MTATTQTTVLRKASKAELEALKEAAREKFYSTQHGHDAFAFTDPKTGRAIAGHVDGAYVPVLVVYPTEILKVYKEKLAEGFTLHELEIVPFQGQSMYIYFYRPQAELDANLEKIYQRVAQDYNAEIEAENNAIVEREVQLLLANAARLKEEQAAKDAEAEADRVRKEVEQALGVARKAVRAQLGAN
ncbi:hypothetical protein PMA3_20655 [Pseudomonas silesiensis]|uniref:Uncharacterized protein n=1 Tax=Pseudomonas silesiensis TaxID=1853130 RepID=A0A191YXE1_9PSED|nr:hypothetical protein [Pseudomonas silesiensis]ANJ57438.1 hypothetical protein PMA3_20655 [Pseudomonas silesiensis]